MFVHLVRGFATLLLLCGALPSHGQQADLTVFAGTWRGEVFNGGDMDPVSIVFALSANGRLAGDYTVDDETGLVQGRVSNVILEDSHTMTCEWTDKYGEGYVRLVFSQDYSRFDGFWGSRDSDSQNPWSGVRQ